MKTTNRSTRTKSYSQLILLPTFHERLKYVYDPKRIGEETFGDNRYYNQSFYTSDEWKRARREAIVRDTCGGYCLDLGCKDCPITGRIYVHHINPITMKDIEEGSRFLFSLENLICVSQETHNTLHYGTLNRVDYEVIERKPNDTIPWR